MTEIAGIPYFEAEFDKNGNPVGQPPSVPRAVNEIFVFSHGWNNDHDAARKLYHAFFTSYAAVAGTVPGGHQQVPGGHQQGIVGILWPSKELDDVVDAAVTYATATGPAASAGGRSQTEADAAISAQLDELEKLLGPESEPVIARLKTLLPDIQDSPSKQREFVDTLRAQLTSRHTDNDEEPSSHTFLTASGPAILGMLANQTPPVAAGAPKAGAASPEGGAAGLIGDIFGGIKGAIIKFVNVFSYFEMKERAGTIGTQGVAKLLDELGKTAERIHLIGHSFGGRVVTAAAKSSSTDRLKTMTLLQAAFSHNGFQPGIGFFRDVIANSRIAGPIIITHTFNDSAVGIAYPAASLLGGQTAAGVSTAGIAAAVGGPNSPFGGLGSNGALHMGTVAIFSDMLELGKPYTFAAGKIYNLKADLFIAEHCDVTGREVAYAVAAAHHSVT
jgi:hypothetical protein